MHCAALSLSLFWYLNRLNPHSVQNLEGVYLRICGTQPLRWANLGLPSDLSPASRSRTTSIPGLPVTLAEIATLLHVSRRSGFVGFYLHSRNPETLSLGDLVASTKHQQEELGIGHQHSERRSNLS